MELTRNREGYLVSLTHRECTECHTIFEKTNSMTLCGECNCKRVKSFSPEWRMRNRCKQRALTDGREFDLELEDIIIPTHCPILHIPLAVNSNAYKNGKYGPNDFSPSLDRIDNSKGYVRENIQVISQRANRMKGAATVDDLKAFALWVNSKFPATD